MNAREALPWVLVAAVGAAAYKWLNKVPDALDAVGSKAGTSAADFRDFVSEALFGPRHSNYFFAVNFAGGVRHAIPIKSQENPGGVDSSGYFTFRGKRFRIRDKTNAQGIREHWAFNA